MLSLPRKMWRLPVSVAHGKVIEISIGCVCGCIPICSWSCGNLRNSNNSLRARLLDSIRYLHNNQVSTVSGMACQHRHGCGKSAFLFGLQPDLIKSACSCGADMCRPLSERILQFCAVQGVRDTQPINSRSAFLVIRVDSRVVGAGIQF